jgi:amino acid transporter
MLLLLFILGVVGVLIWRTTAALPNPRETYKQSRPSEVFGIFGLSYLLFWLCYVVTAVMSGQLTDSKGTPPIADTMFFFGWISFVVVSFYFAFRRPPFKSMSAWRVFFIVYVCVAFAMPLLMFSGGYCFVPHLCVPQIY